MGTIARKVLVIAFDFPPRRTSAVYRNTNLTKYLAENGWQPTVLTVRENIGGVEEPELLDRLPPEVRIERTRYLAVDGWEKATAETIRTAGVLNSRYDEPKQSLVDRCVRRVGNLVRSSLYFPDNTVGWVPFAVARGMRLIRKGRFDLIYVMSPPRSVTVVGFLLKLLLGTPWVLEFQDPWYPPPRPFRRKFEHWLQVAMVRKADAVIVMTDGHKQDFMHRFHLPEAKLAVVRNGYCEDDFNSLTGPRRNLLPPGYIHISHFGTIYPENSGCFFQALAELLQEQPELGEKLRVNIIGDPNEDCEWTQYSRREEVQRVIHRHGFVPHDTVRRLMQESDYLLLFWGRPHFSRLAVAGKTYEYLRVGRPILAVTHEGGVQKLVEEGRAGYVMNPRDVEAIKKVLRTVATLKSDDWPPEPPRPEFVAQFRWDSLAKQLAAVFDRVIRYAR
jgi:glycosyltransferase involved in cell wall biosynthesis